MRYFLSEAKRRLPCLSVASALALTCACGDDAALATQEDFDRAVAVQNAASGGDASRPFRRAPGWLEVDIAPPPSDEAGEGAAAKTRKIQGKGGRIWRIKPADAGVAGNKERPATLGDKAAAEARRPRLEGPRFSFSEREDHVAQLAELAGKKKLAEDGEGGVRLHVMAHPMTRDEVLHLVRLTQQYHEAWVQIFNTRAAPLPEALLEALVQGPPPKLGEIAVLYRKHVSAVQPGLDLSRLDAAKPSLEMGYLPASLEAEAVLLYVETCYAMLNMAHRAGSFSDWGNGPVQGVDIAQQWVFLVGRIDGDLAGRLEALRSKRAAERGDEAATKDDADKRDVTTGQAKSDRSAARHTDADADTSVDADADTDDHDDADAVIETW